MAHSGPMTTGAISARGWLAEIIRPLLWVLFISLVLNVLALATPLFAMQVCDQVIQGSATGAGRTISLLGLAATLVYAALAALAPVRHQVLAGLNDLIEEQFGAIMLRRAASPRTGVTSRPVVAVIGRDLDILRQFAAGPALLGLIDLPFTPVFLAVIAILHWELGVAALLCMAAQGLLSLLAARGAASVPSRGPENGVHADDFGDAVTRHADCASTMGLGSGLTRRWQRLRGRVFSIESATNRTAGELAAASLFCGLFSRSLIIGVGALLARQHEIGAGGVFAAFMLLGLALAPLESTTGAWRAVLTARAALRRIQAEVPRWPATQSSALPQARGELVLEGIAWTPPGASRPALRGVTLKIEAGAVLAVIGPSAAGKSTLARVLCGALRPTQGIARLDSAELASWNEEQLGAAIGYLPQDIALFPGTIAENICRFGHGTEFQIMAAARLAGVHDMIKQLPAGYQTVVDDNRCLLSAGQRQRVALARALFGDPPVLVLDEPDASLDAEGEAALIGCVIEARRRRRTVIMITHNTGLVRVADFVATMVGGHIMKVQRTAEVLGRPAMLAKEAVLF
jgi:ATP-binding cassette subfamily C protein